MISTISLLFLVAYVTAGLVLFLLGLIVRRWIVAFNEKRHTLHMRLLRSELLQALARGNSMIDLDHWSTRDRKAAFVVASQLLCLIRGHDKERLLDIIESNRLLHKRLARINRFGKLRRIATIQELAPFDCQSVRGTLNGVMQDDPDTEVRVEAALVLAKWGALPSPWQILKSIYTNCGTILPAHRQLFRALMPVHAEGLLAMALYQENRIARLLAIDGLGQSNDAKIAISLGQLVNDEDKDIRREVIVSARRIGQPAALSWVQKALYDDCPELRDIAAETMMTLEGVQPAKRRSAEKR